MREINVNARTHLIWSSVFGKFPITDTYKILPPKYCKILHEMNILNTQKVPSQPHRLHSLIHSSTTFILQPHSFDNPIDSSTYSSKYFHVAKYRDNYGKLIQEKQHLSHTGHTLHYQIAVYTVTALYLGKIGHLLLSHSHIVIRY